MAAGLLNMLPQVPSVSNLGFNFAIYSKQRANYASQVRHLRRREYQDMMFSMRKAGLNPMLASGATPGHSAAMQGTLPGGTGGAGVGTAMAALKQAETAEKTGQTTRDKIAQETTNAQYTQAVLNEQASALAADRRLKDTQAIVEKKKAGLIDQQTAHQELQALLLSYKKPMAQMEGKYGKGPAALGGAARYARDKKMEAAEAIERSTLSTSAEDFRKWWNSVPHEE